MHILRGVDIVKSVVSSDTVFVLSMFGATGVDSDREGGTMYLLGFY